MNAHTRLVSSEAPDAERHDLREGDAGLDEAPIGLPEEAGSLQNECLGPAQPPLVADAEDHARGAPRAGARTKKDIWKLIAFPWRRTPNRPASLVAGERAKVEGDGGAGRDGEGERKAESAASAAAAPVSPMSLGG